MLKLKVLLKMYTSTDKALSRVGSFKHDYAGDNNRDADEDSEEQSVHHLRHLLPF